MIYVLIGKSSCGKDTVMRAVMDSNKNIHNPVSYTSRPMRVNEINGKDYNFLTKETFLIKLENGELLEYREYNTISDGENVTWYYGLPFSAFENDKDYIVVIDLIGAKKLYENRDDVRIINIEASDEVRFARSILRDNIIDTEDHRILEVKRRMDADNIEFCEKEIEKICSLSLTNDRDDDLDEVIDGVLKLINSK